MISGVHSNPFSDGPGCQIEDVMEKQFDAGGVVAAPVFAGFVDHDEV